MKSDSVSGPGDYSSVAPRINNEKANIIEEI